MLKIGLTGGIGSGKSLVARVFEELFEIPVFYADHVAKNLMSTDNNLQENIIQLLGNESYTANGTLNKPFVAKKIFNNPELRTELNKQVHKKVRDTFNIWVSKQKTGYILHEAAILIESGFHKQMDQIINVVANENIRIERIRKRDKLSKEQILQRMEAQLGDEERNNYADFIIINDNKNSITSQVKKIHLKLLAHG
ncbi:MAG TPA: dephospho-CoA kinase [Salinivirga sp.]|uniref:dephospho-CoA kinase n=1 Tax=Salinivirga sp. TaxID=1970192 RepID=UPI002B4A64CB|nr:dephospho-CoA kinase [Salinivirga sp.]HKK59842.1 dephospho-CoA kinase [Salinivirga sp.]